MVAERAVGWWFERSLPCCSTAAVLLVALERSAHTYLPPSLFPLPGNCRYFLLCAPQSAVQQCLDQPPIRSLRPAVQFFTEVLKLCNGTRAAMPGGSSARGAVTNASLDGADLALDADLEAACRNCSAVSADPDKVVVQATEANCPDPLGASCFGGRLGCW